MNVFCSSHFKHSEAQHSTAQHITAQHSTMHHNPTQPNPTQQRPLVHCLKAVVSTRYAPQFEIIERQCCCTSLATILNTSEQEASKRIVVRNLGCANLNLNLDQQDNVCVLRCSKASVRFRFISLSWSGFEAKQAPKPLSEVIGSTEHITELVWFRS